MKRPLQRQLSSMSNFTTSLWMGIASFLISMLLHLLVGYIYHRVHPYQKMLPLRPCHPRRDTPIRLKLVLSVEDSDYHDIKYDPKLCKKTHVMTRSYITQHWASSAPENPYDDIHVNTPRLPYLRLSRLKLFSSHFWDPNFYRHNLHYFCFSVFCPLKSSLFAC